MLCSSLTKFTKSSVPAQQEVIPVVKGYLIFKPALSRGEISIIGATTQDEYRNNIMKDAALTRRFNEVLVNEPSAKDTVEILKGIRENLKHTIKSNYLMTY